MVVEERIYTMAPGTIPAMLELYEREGLAVHKRNLGNLIGYFVSDIGDLNLLVQLWGFADMQDRAVRREKLWSDPEWLAFTAKVPAPLKMQNRILLPTRFSPIQ